MMSTQKRAEHGVIQSSIALLQERFKQLQRVKEMREKRELLRMFSDYNTTTPSTTTCTNNTPSTTNNIINNNVTSTTTADSTPNDSTMQTSQNNKTITNKFWSDPVGDDELQIFLPPNYYYYNYNHKPSSCNYSLSSSSSSSLNNHTLSSTTSTTTTTLNNEVSLSLWPPTSQNATVASSDHFRRASYEAPALSTMEIMKSSRPCLSSAYNKFEDSHVSDVDTTLHL